MWRLRQRCAILGDPPVQPFAVEMSEGPLRNPRLEAFSNDPAVSAAIRRTGACVRTLPTAVLEMAGRTVHLRFTFAAAKKARQQSRLCRSTRCARRVAQDGTDEFKGLLVEDGRPRVLRDHLAAISPCAD